MTPARAEVVRNIKNAMGNLLRKSGQMSVIL